MNRHILYAIVLCLLNPLIYTEDWGSTYLSLIILITYFTYLPKELLHPNNMLIAFYGLYIVVSSTLNLILSWIHWNYVLPWGQQVYWNQISKYVLYQAEFTFLILFFSFRYFSRAKNRDINVQATPIKIDRRAVYILSIMNVLLVVWFLESTAGITNWIMDYSYTYLAKREGHGLLNIVNITLGNVLVFILGLWTQRSPRKLIPILLAIVAIALQSYMNGFKGRLIFLLIMYFSPWLILMRINIKSLSLISITFFVLLYTATLVRTEGFYASGIFFMEMLIGYFNAHQLHELIVSSRDPGFLQTVWQIFVKPLQSFGLLGPDVDFDISVMLTKEFFPEHWYREKATQQWPLDTELYLNYFGFYLSWIPLLIYASFVGFLFRISVLKRNLWLMPVFILEFNRIFSALRGTLIPWEIFFIIVQYPVIYLIARRCIRPVGSKRSSIAWSLEPKRA